MIIHALAAHQPGAPLERYRFDAGSLRPDQVEIAVETCGLCQSDLAMWKNEWHQTTYPFVPGHEVVGRIAAVGAWVTQRKVGETVGLGWVSGSCMACPQCMSGHHHLCATSEQTVVTRPGGFAQRVRSHWAWAIPVPAGLDTAKAGPFFCGGITVFAPLVEFGIKPTDRVGVVGIGGLGHLAVQFLNKWGCEVTAFTSSATKTNEVRCLGAHHVVATHDDAALKKLARSLDFLLVTGNAPLAWRLLIETLAPRGRLHVVGSVLEPIPVSVSQLMDARLAISSSPLGSPATTADMLAFSARHGIAPQVEFFPMSKANEAFAHLAEGKARYRIVLKNDL